MVINSFRGLAVILLALIIIVKEAPFKKLFKDAMIQFYLALACMLVLLLVDNILGFILSICVLTLYFRIYTSELKSKNTGDEAKEQHTTHHKHSKSCDGSEKCEMNMEHLATEKIKIAANSTMADGSVPYITEENLLAAQSNIVNPAEYNREQHCDNVYGSQGLDTKHLHIRGFDTTTQFLGSLSYDIII